MSEARYVAAPERTITLAPPYVWGPRSTGWTASDPIRDIRSMQEMSPFWPLEFVFNAKTAAVFLDNPVTIGFVISMGAVEVLERRRRQFTVRGLADFEVIDDVPDGVVLMYRRGCALPFAMLNGAIGKAETTDESEDR